MADFSGPAKPLLSLNPQDQARFQKQVAQARRRATQQEKLTPGVVYVGHIPRGLFEPQLKAYFSQFGTVTRLKLSRSKKTGNSKGYAFVEFESDDVAKIVAETMNNYLFGERLLKCDFMPPEKVHEKVFKDWDVPFSKPSYPAVKRYNKKRSLTQKLRMEKRFKNKEKLLRKKLAKKGIVYNFPSLILPKKKKGNVSNTDLQSSTNSQILHVMMEKKKVSGTLSTPEKTVYSDKIGSTPVCTPTFLERRKCEVAEMNDDEEDKEIIFKQPVAGVKEEAQETQTSTRSGKKRQRRRKSKQ
ncbi:MKI67 FHA domain-interacting nucleolar phosphoprotein isoform X2 [Elephas maximus indicus]|uniref:MKI67 FHA domain-interacting nucleolar phosphoprotein isoform X2 n=1 Tax=Elephas maximus indicus TaxID=99487 RepID=UPI0021167ED1|nr:MKI67 FHA domain-interacting nucleolar phosphoprotein isoform X2 [Elephas maximus indicus]